MATAKTPRIKTTATAADKMNLSKPVKVEPIKATMKRASKAIPAVPVEKPTRVTKKRDASRDALNKAADKAAKAGDKAAKPKKNRNVIETLKVGKVVIERPNRKKSDSFDTIASIQVKGGADTIKVFSKLPKGFSWLTDLTASTKDTLLIFNKHGVHIADLRINRK